LRHRVVNPLQLLAIEFRWPSEQRLGLQRAPAATPILRQPAIDRRTIDPQNISNNFRAFTIWALGRAERLYRRDIRYNSGPEYSCSGKA
jgi:hypothetical protein